MLQTIKQIAGQVTVGDLEETMGCPACQFWTDTRDGRKECNHQDGWRPSFGTMHCANTGTTQVRDHSKSLA